MKSTVTLFLLCFWIAGDNALGDTITVVGNARISLGGETQSFSINDSGTITANAFTTIIEDQDVSVDTDGNPFNENVLFFDMKASYVGNKFAYTLRLEHDAHSNASAASFDVNIRLSEDWGLSQRLPTAVLPDLALIGRYVFSARVDHTFAAYADNNSGTSTGNPYSVSVFTGIDIGNITIGETVFNDNFSTDLNKTLGIRYGVAGQNAGSFLVEFNTDVGLALDSILEVFSWNSFDLVRVEFEDGSTPEDHGFDFVRGSGRVSPNISAVPEPSSFVFLFVVCLVIWISQKHRRL